MIEIKLNIDENNTSAVKALAEMLLAMSNTQSEQEGKVLYVHPTNPGELTDQVPEAPKKVKQPKKKEEPTVEPETTQEAEPETTQEAEPAQEEITIEQIREVANRKIDNNRADIVKKLNELGVKNLPSLPKELYPEFLEFLNKL